jgi:hypothetical protein
MLSLTAFAPKQRPNCGDYWRNAGLIRSGTRLNSPTEGRHFAPPEPFTARGAEDGEHTGNTTLDADTGRCRERGHRRFIFQGGFFPIRLVA